MWRASSWHDIDMSITMTTLRTRVAQRYWWLSVMVISLFVFLWIATSNEQLRMSGYRLIPMKNMIDAQHVEQVEYQAKDQRRAIDISSDALPLEATLQERLDVWRNSPGGRGNVSGEVESGDFVQWNLEQCESVTPQHNTQFNTKSAHYWGSLTRQSLHTLREGLITYMEKVLQNGDHLKYGEGRGIVMLGGNVDTFTRMKWSIQMIRSYGSELPIQIFHFPSERPKPEDPIWQEMKSLNAELIEIKNQTRDSTKNKSYHLKASAIVQSSWREVLYLDSDSIPTRDPEYMFSSPNYKRLGIWITPDYWKTSGVNPIWSILGVKCRNEWEFETGQFFVDKKRHLDVFLLSEYMLQDYKFWFQFSDGDKDIFRFALLALRKRWATPGKYVGAAGLPTATHTGDFCAHTMLQHDSWGNPLFVHYNLFKMIPSGVGRHYSWGRTKGLPMISIGDTMGEEVNEGDRVVEAEERDEGKTGDVDCDMLADADEEGVARSPASKAVRDRAVMEKTVKAEFHGGQDSALCINMVPADPKSPEPVPLEISQWNDDPHLSTFQNKLYDLGFIPSAVGF